MSEVNTDNSQTKKATGWPLAIVVTLVFLGLIAAWYFLIRTALENKPDMIEVKPAAENITERPSDD